MIPWRFKQWFPANGMHCRRELTIALDFIAACMIAQLFLDHWLATLVREYQSSPLVRALSLMPDRVTIIVAASRFIIGAHYLSDVLLGCAVGLAIVVLMQTLFSQCGIYLRPQGPTEQ
jgi:hypothetical protein